MNQMCRKCQLESVVSTSFSHGVNILGGRSQCEPVDTAAHTAPHLQLSCDRVSRRSLKPRDSLGQVFVLSCDMARISWPLPPSFLLRGENPWLSRPQHGHGLVPSVHPDHPVEAT